MAIKSNGDLVKLSKQSVEKKYNKKGKVASLEYSDYLNFHPLSLPVNGDLGMVECNEELLDWVCRGLLIEEN